MHCVDRWSQTTEAASHLNRVSVLIMDVASTGDGQTNNESIQTCEHRTSHVHILKHVLHHWMIFIASYHHAAWQFLSVPEPDLAKVAVWSPKFPKALTSGHQDRLPSRSWLGQNQLQEGLLGRFLALQVERKTV